MGRSGTILIALTLLMALGVVTSAVERFPPPEFETDYERPTATTPHPRSDRWEYIDAAVLVAALSLASYLILRRRSRKAVFALMLFSNTWEQQELL